MRCRTLLLGVLLFGPGCTGPDGSRETIAALPAPVLDWLRPDSLVSRTIGPGVTHRYLWSPEGPWAVHLVEARLDRCDLGIEVVRAPRDPEMRGGLARVTEMVADHARPVVAAVNGDFFTREGMPIGPEVSGGIIRNRRRRDALVVRRGEPPRIGPVGVTRGTVPRVDPGGWPVEGRGAVGVQLVGGYPELLDEGARVGDLGVEENASFAASRHPRTAVGWDPQERRLWLVVVDGRQGEYSKGMTLPELATLFEALGVPEALNLDGGGSSVLVVDGEAVNRPSDAEGERAVVNALLLVDDPAFCVSDPRRPTRP